MRLHVVPGQVRERWCRHCSTWSAVDVGVYLIGDDGPPELVGTLEGCPTCDPDMFNTDPTVDGG